MVLQVCRAGVSVPRGPNFLRKAPFHCPGHTTFNLVQNLCSQICRILCLSAHTYYIFSRAGVMVSNIHALHKAWEHIFHSSRISVFGICGFANLQARLNVPSNSSLASTFGQSSNCPTHCKHRQKGLPTPSQASPQISISLGYLVPHSFQITFTYIILSSLQNRSVWPLYRWTSRQMG